MKQIEDYLNGDLIEDEALKLWVCLLKKPKDFELLNIYLSLKTYYELNN